MKVYGLAVHDKYAISYFAKGMTNFAEIEFFVNGVIPEVGGILQRCLRTASPSIGVAPPKNVSS